MRRSAAFLALFAALFFLRCAADAPGIVPADAGFDRPFPTDDAAIGDADVTPPGAVTDLAIDGIDHDAITITWTAPADTFAYQIRYAKTSIKDVTDFGAATPVPSPVPKPAGGTETLRISGLEPDTMYWFAVRARDAAGNLGELSNVASGTTKPRATFLVTEIAETNGALEGFDFVEIVATKAGSAKNIVVRQEGEALYTLGDLDVVMGDRIVVHVTGNPSPAGFVQEDVTKNKTSSTAAFHSADAYDVYSAVPGITGTDNVVSIVDGPKTLDAVAFSDRDGTASNVAMAAFAKARSDTAWSFSTAPVDGTNDCLIQGEAVGVSTGDTTCGGFRTGIDNGFSINRNGVVDTNTKADFYVAAQTPGQPNAAIAPPRILFATPTNATTVELRFDQEILASTAPLASFTIAGLAVSAASTSSNRVVLTTAAQTGVAPYTVAIANTVANHHGVGVSTTSARFCGYAPVGATVRINEIAPDQAGSADLVELLVEARGALAGWQLRLNPTTVGAAQATLATLPPICAAAGDVVVVHLQPPAGTNGPTSETTSKSEHPNATYSANHDGAWDVLGGSTLSALIPHTDAIIGLRDATGTYRDVVALSNVDNDFGNEALMSLAFVQAQALWTPATCAGVACDAMTAQSVCVDWRNVGTTPAGDSVRRAAAGSTASSWSVGAASFGAPNP